ncbi:hypothetical protein [uncultured Paraglaciecola sp.]|uniref:hypothetical protein n=1 Tax=uncultured Paraglaciecola sp. TaxID=1765024 RepID=UPI00259571AD|nr:hypothetical protein [uncultured Paraglaciecola sp.]
MRNSIIGILIILISGCNTTERGSATQTPENVLIPIPFKAPADQISYNAYIPECTKNCNVKLMMDIRETSSSFNYFPFVAFAIQDEKQEHSAQVQVEYAPNKDIFEYSIVTRHKDTVVDKKLLSEHSLPDMFQFSVQWTNDRFTVTPYIKEVGDGWFRHVPSENALITNLQFTPYSYAYLASGSQGRFILFSGEQNILSLNKQSVNVKPIEKNDL